MFCYYTQDDSLISKIGKSILKEAEYYLYFDGASSFIPGTSRCGYVIYDSLKKLYASSSNTGKKTNNQAEYFAILNGM